MIPLDAKNMSYSLLLAFVVRSTVVKPGCSKGRNFGAACCRFVAAHVLFSGAAASLGARRTRVPWTWLTRKTDCSQ